MEIAEARPARERSPYFLVVVGFAVGAAAGAAGHLAGLDRWALVPICAGIGGGVGSAIARIRASWRSDRA